MNRQIDEKVVRMSLENGQFESAIDKSIASIEKLEKKLEFKDAGDGFNDIQKSANKVDLSHIEKALDSLNDKFTLLGMTGVKMLDKISTKAVDVGMKMAKSLTIQAPLDGLNEYELKLNSIQTILANTRSKGTQLSDVTTALDELNTYADKTVYVFSDMTRAIGQFTTAGVDLKASVAAVKGMSNLAATVGADNAALSRANYQVSQALNTGYFRLMDWRSLENAAGMGGEMMQEALKQTAREYGVAIDSIIAKNGSFRESLRDNWLTAEIYLKTMEKFSDPTRYPEYQFMEDAATKVRTFKKLVETTMESIGSQWAGIWERIIGNFDEATALWSGINKIINSNNSPLISALNTLQNVLDQWRARGGRDNLIKGLVQLLGALWTYIRPIAYALADTFRLTGTGLANATKSFADFTAKLQLGEKGAKGLYNIFRSIFLVIKTMIKVHNALWAAMSPLIDLFNYVLNKVLGVTGEVGDTIDKLSHDIDILIKIGQVLIHDVLEKVVNILIEAFENVDLDDIKDVLIDIAKVLGAAFVFIAETVKIVLPFVAKLIKILPSIGKYLKAILTSLASTGKIVAEYMREKISAIFKMIASLDIGTLFRKFVTAGYAVIQGIVTGLISGVHAVVETIQNIGLIMLEAFKQVLGIASPSKVFYDETSWVTVGIVKSITDGTAKAVVATKNMAGAMANGYAEEVNSGSLSDIILGPSSIFEKLLAILLYLGDKIKWAITHIGDIFKWTLELIVTSIKKLLDVTKSLFDVVKEQFVNLRDYITETWGIDWSEVFRIAILTGIIISLIAVVRAVIKIGSMASMLIKTFATMSKTLKIFARSFTGQFSPVTNFIEALGLIVLSFVALLVVIQKGGITQQTLIWASSIMAGIVAAIIVMIVLVGGLQSKGVVLNKGQKLVASTKGLILGFIVILGIIVYLVKTLATVKTDKLNAIADVLSAILAMLLTIEGVATLIGKYGKVDKAFKETIAILGSVTTLAISLAATMYILSQVDYTQLDQGRGWLIAFGAIVIGILAAVWLLGATTFANDGLMKPLFGISSLIVSIGVLFTTIAAAFVVLGEVDWDNVTKGWPYLLIAVGLIAAIVAVTILIFKITNKANAKVFAANGKGTSLLGSLSGMAAIIASVGVLFMALALSFKILSYVDWNGISDGAVYIGIAALMVTIIIVAISAMVAALNKNKDASFLGKDGKVDQKSNVTDALSGIAKVISKIGTMFIAIAIAFRILDNVDWTKINDGSVYLIGAVAVLLLIIFALYKIAKISKSTHIGESNELQGVGDVIKAMSKLIISIAAFFILCWFVDWVKVKEGAPLLIGAAGFIILLMGMFVAMAAVGKGKNVLIKNMGGMLLGMMGVVLAIGMLFMLMSYSLVDAKKIVKMEGALWAVAAIILALGAVLVLLGALASKKGNKVASTILVFMGMFTLVLLAMTAMMFAIGQAQVTPRQLQGINNIVTIIMAITGIIVLLTGIIGLSDRVSKNVSSLFASLSLLMISIFAGVALMTMAAKDVKINALEKLKETILWITGIIAVMIVLMSAISAFTGGIGGMISFAVLGGIAIVFAAVALAIYSIGAAVNKVADAMEKISKLNPEKLSKNITTVVDSIKHLKEAIFDTDGSAAGFAITLWAICIPALILSIAFFNIALGMSLVLGTIGLLALAVLGLAFAFGKLNGVDLSNFGNSLADIISGLATTISDLFNDPGVQEALTNLANTFVNVVKDGLKSLLEDLGLDWIFDPVGSLGDWNGRVNEEAEEWAKAGAVGKKYTKADLKEIAWRALNEEDTATRRDYTFMYALLSQDLESSLTQNQARFRRNAFASDNGYDAYLKMIQSLENKYAESFEELAKGYAPAIGQDIKDYLSNITPGLGVRNDETFEKAYAEAIQKDDTYKFADKEYLKEMWKSGKVSFDVESEQLTFTDPEKIYIRTDKYGNAITVEGDIILRNEGTKSPSAAIGQPNLFESSADALALNNQSKTGYASIGVGYPGSTGFSVLDGYISSNIISNTNASTLSDVLRTMMSGIKDGTEKIADAADKFATSTKESISNIADKMTGKMTGFASIGLGYEGNIGLSVLDGYQASVAMNAETKTESKPTNKESDDGGFLGINWSDVGSWFMDGLSTLGGYAMDFWEWIKEKFSNGIDWIKDWAKRNFPETYDKIVALAYSLGLYTAAAEDWTNAWIKSSQIQHEIFHDQSMLGSSWQGASHAAIELAKAENNKYATISRDFSPLDYEELFNDLVNKFKDDFGLNTPPVTTPDLSNMATDNFNQSRSMDTELSDNSEDTQRIQDIIFNQYNYSPEELDRTEIYKQTKAQINAFKEYMQYY